MIHFKTSRRLETIGKQLGCHIERCIDLQKSIQYCQKEETRKEGPWEIGEKPGIGGRPKTTKELLELTEQERYETLGPNMYNACEKAKRTHDSYLNFFNGPRLCL